MTISVHGIATDAWSRIPNEIHQWKEKKKSRMELRVACRKMKYQKKMMNCWGDHQQQTPRSNRLRDAIEQQLLYRNQQWRPVRFKLKSSTKWAPGY
ncbi:MAG: hypothetical protein EZS28_033363 [Streblomastix strix]|uniref:Uncharacterized protein n=1 Tax=Streblomastix strix TaxID=222440 RepID=A0A5J4UKT6_9EUKA|nr:MAG: hypothetical protein EZS28_033363 [Streblomastix strix]